MYLILCDFLFHSTQIAGFLVSILASEILLTASNIFTAACAMFVFFQLFIVYWHGQILIEESGSISTSIYESNWYEADNKTRKLLILMMKRSQKPLGVTVGPFFFVDMELFLKIVKAVYSITTIFFRT
ncbi:odorant receptor 30a-like [Coccinella septempunctata]|uniref:odorant receptor 30a-like n=1 Tax=Coccinella septempunctata TaxID=41139 RepID=UPI001D085B53|nr:odorant receptor 30a-like [Coccinella septempunctata]